MSLPSNLTLIDLAIIVSYFVAVLGVGIWMGRGERDTTEFVVGGRKMPWLAVLCSIVATEISAATFVAVPTEGFSGNLNYLQFGIGSFVARFVVASVFISAFYAAGVMTVYEYLARRFGERSRYTATAFFLGGRVLASGTRLFIATTALASVFDVPMWLSLFLFTVAAIIYTWAGGIRSVIWTDVIQACVFIGGGLAIVAFLQVTTGWGSILSEAGAAGKLELIRLTPSEGGFWGWMNDPNLFYVALVNGFLITTAALGTDQDLTQRMLSCSDSRRARRSVILSGFVGIPVAAGFLFIGIGLWVYFRHLPLETLPWAESGDPRLVFPHFVTNVLPSGLRGLLIAGIFATAMSSIDSALGALSSSAVVDLYKPLLRPGRSEAHYLLACRWAVPMFGALMCLVAWLMRENQEMLWLALKVATVPAGALLGVFLLGLLTNKGSDNGNVIAMISSAVYSGLMLALTETGLHPLAWSWVIVPGTLWTISVALLFGLREQRLRTSS